MSKDLDIGAMIAGMAGGMALNQATTPGQVAAAQAGMQGAERLAAQSARKKERDNYIQKITTPQIQEGAWNI